MKRGLVKPAHCCALFGAFGLSACGGGSTGSGVVVTPPPPISTTETYYSIDEVLKKDFTLQAAGYVYNGQTQKYSPVKLGGVTISYQKSSGNYTVSAPGGPTSVFGPQDHSGSLGYSWSKADGTKNQSFYLLDQQSVSLTYAAIGVWDFTDSSTGEIKSWTFIAGSSTIRSDMPTGTATYTMAVIGSAGDGKVGGPLATGSNATLTANFGAGTVSTMLDLGTRGSAGTEPLVKLGTFSGQGTIDSGGPGFSGTLTGSKGSGDFSGAFFGPKAAQAGYAFYLTGADFAAIGEATGYRQP